MEDLLLNFKDRSNRRSQMHVRDCLILIEIIFEDSGQYYNARTSLNKDSSISNHIYLVCKLLNMFNLFYKVMRK